MEQELFVTKEFLISDSLQKVKAARPVFG